MRVRAGRGLCTAVEGRGVSEPIRDPYVSVRYRLYLQDVRYQFGSLESSIVFFQVRIFKPAYLHGPAHTVSVSPCLTSIAFRNFASRIPSFTHSEVLKRKRVANCHVGFEKEKSLSLSSGKLGAISHHCPATLTSICLSGNVFARFCLHIPLL